MNRQSRDKGKRIESVLPQKKIQTQIFKGKENLIHKCGLKRGPFPRYFTGQEIIM